MVNKTQLPYLSLCSGIEAVTVAWNNLPFEPVAFAEIEKFPCAVLNHHYPHVPNLGDMTNIDGKAFTGLIDILVGGTPCQSFSLAGARRSLDDARGNLTLKFADLCDEISPSYILWENVPGVLSTKDNAFGCLLGALAGVKTALPLQGKRWSNAGYVFGPTRTVAWRILDAQFFGVPQRRRRVYIVACPRERGCPLPILFEPKSVSGYYAESAGTRQTHPATSQRSIRKNDKCCIYENHAQDARMTPCIIAPTITQRYGTGGNNIPLYVTPHQQVRKLTPLECERLQGFPDDYTRIPYRGRPAEKCPDSPRYKALGNSMAVPVVKWIGARLIEQHFKHNI